jgi:hypothetical protein
MSWAPTSQSTVIFRGGGISPGSQTKSIATARLLRATTNLGLAVRRS